MVDYNISAYSSDFDQFKRRSTNREVDPSSAPTFNKSPLDDKTSSGFGGMGPDPEQQAKGLGSPTKQANKKDDDDDKEVGGFARFLNKFFGAAEASGLEFSKPNRKPKPSIYDRDDMKPIDFDAMDKRIADAVNFDLANPLPSMNFKDDEYAASTYDEVQPLEGADTYKARRITAQGINDTIKGLMDTEQRQADIKQAVNKTIESLRSADANVPYVIQAGDTLSDIAAKTGTTVQDLVKRNKIKDKEKIYTGNELIIPTDKTTKSKEDVVSNLVTGMDSGEYLKSRAGKQDSSFEGEGIEVADNRSLLDTLLSLVGMGKTEIADSVTTVTSDMNNEENVKIVQQYLTDSGYDPKGVDGIAGNNTKKAIQRLQANNGLSITGILDDTTKELINSGNAKGITSKKIGNLTIATGNRDDHSSSDLKISLDYNSAENPLAKGTLVVIPDNASAEVRAAAEKFNDLIVAFAASKGYTDYKNRGVKTRSENKRGVTNTIHVEPFFQQDNKMQKIVNENFNEFANLYTEAFGNVNAKMIAPHGSINSKGIQDKGATSSVFGTELDFGNKIIEELM